MEQVKMGKPEAVAKMKEWADYLEVASDGEDWDNAVDVLTLPIINDRLDFNKEDETFTIVLKAPIEMASGKKEILTIRELAIDEKRCVERYKDSEKISMVEAIYAKSCGLTLAEASKIKGRDFTVIATINSVFFS
jgi:hypothetical protein